MGKWTTIKVPIEVANKVREVSARTGKPAWQVVLEGIECRERTKTKAYSQQNIDELDRVSYYIMKLMISVERFKLKPNGENLMWLEKTANQIRDRLGVDVGYVVRAAKEYARTLMKDDYVELNMMAKLAIGDILRGTVLRSKEEEAEKKEG
ncbi:MAG: hypothetical protein ABGW50_02055 [Thermococcus sp.]